MKKVLLLLVAAVSMAEIKSQYIYKIKADSVLITNDSCTAELNLENSTKSIKGFLYNKGNGRTEFRAGLIKINDSTYIIGNDTLKLKTGTFGNPWLQGGNSFGALGKFGLSDSNHIDFYTNNIVRGRLTSNGGNLLLGTTTSNGEKLQVNGSIFTSTGTIKSNGGVSIPPTISFIGNQNAGNIFIGHSTAPAWADHNPRGIMIQTQKNIQSDVAKTFQVTIGASNTDSSSSAVGIILGSFNTQKAGSYYGATMIGHSNTYIPAGAASVAADIIIGDHNIYTGNSSIILGNNSNTSLTNVFIAAGNYSNGQGGITNVFFGNGDRANTMHNMGNGLNYTINGSGAATATDKNGGTITIAGGKGTGAGTPGNIIFSSATALSSGSTLQSLSEKARIVGSTGNVLIGTTTDNGNKLQVNGTVGVSHPTFTTGSGAGMSWTANNTFRVSGGPSAESLTFGPANRITSSVQFHSPSFFSTNPVGSSDANYYVPAQGGIYTTSGSPSNGSNIIYHKFTNAGPSANSGTGSPTFMELNKLVSRGSQDGLETGLRITFTVTGTANNLRALETVMGAVKLNTTSGRTSIGLDSATAATSRLDVNGEEGYNQLRLRKNYTPSSSSDTNGNTGDVCWDDNYIYIKTSTGWKRVALSTF